MKKHVLIALMILFSKTAYALDKFNDEILDPAAGVIAHHIYDDKQVLAELKRNLYLDQKGLNKNATVVFPGVEQSEMERIRTVRKEGFESRIPMWNEVIQAFATDNNNAIKRLKELAARKNSEWINLSKGKDIE